MLRLGRWRAVRCRSCAIILFSAILSPRRNILVLGHAGHNHLMICVVRHPRDHAQWLMGILYQPRRGYTLASWAQQGIAGQSEMLQQLVDKSFDRRLTRY